MPVDDALRMDVGQAAQNLPHHAPGQQVIQGPLIQGLPQRARAVLHLYVEHLLLAWRRKRGRSTCTITISHAGAARSDCSISMCSHKHQDVIIWPACPQHIAPAGAPAGSPMTAAQSSASPPLLASCRCHSRPAASPAPAVDEPALALLPPPPLSQALPWPSWASVLRAPVAGMDERAPSDEASDTRGRSNAGLAQPRGLKAGCRQAAPADSVRPYCEVSVSQSASESSPTSAGPSPEGASHHACRPHGHVLKRGWEVRAVAALA